MTDERAAEAAEAVDPAAAGGVSEAAEEAVVDAELIEEEVTEGPILEEAGPVEPHDLGIELPADPEAAIDLLLREVAASRADADAYLTDLQRLAAEFENFRKRTTREQRAHVERASQRVVENLLPVLDSFDAAFTHEAQSPSEEKLLSGVRSTYHQLLDVLKREGLDPIPALGESFDPEVHEAVSSLASGDGDLVVAAELRRGYRLGGRVLRPALVTVDHA